MEELEYIEQTENEILENNDSGEEIFDNGDTIDSTATDYVLSENDTTDTSGESEQNYVSSGTDTKTESIVNPDTEQNELIEHTEETDIYTGEIHNDIIIDALRNIIMESSDNIEEDEFEESEESGESDRDENMESHESIDYTSILNSILDELSDSNINDEFVSYLDTYESSIENNNMNAPLSEQNATNVLLIFVIILLMIETSIHVIRGLL